MKTNQPLDLSYKNWSLNSIDKTILDLAIKEDLVDPLCDITTQTLFKEIDDQQLVKIISKDTQNIVICGLPITHAILDKLNAKYKIQTSFCDGNILKPNETLLLLESNAQSLLMAERLILNFLRHLSAIATLTNQFVKKIEHTKTKILDTRKTTPGLRHFEKYAVYCGGGINHRMGLYDAYMIKDTHLDLIGGIKNALEKIPSKNENTLPVIIEIRNLDELHQTIQFGRNKVTRVLLDNMPIKLLKEAVSLCQNIFETEASGNINLDTISAIAETGVNYASVGMLTYAADQVDLSMQGIN